MPAKLRIGLLGASRIAPKAVIEPARRREGDVEVRAVAANEHSKAKNYAAEHDIPVALHGYKELINRDDIDIVYCALPPASHLTLCLAALAAGKALLVEKPFALNSAAAAAIAAAATPEQPALEAFHYRFHDLFKQALHAVRGGVIGRIRSAEGVFEADIANRPDELRWRPELGGGGTMDLGCYVLHALRTLLDEEPDVLSADGRIEGGVDVTMSARLSFPSGVEASTFSSMRGVRRDWLELRGDEGIIRLNNFVAPQRGGSMVIDRRTGSNLVIATGSPSYDAQLEHLVQVVHGREPALTGGVDAVSNMRLLDRIRTAAGMNIDF